MINLTKIFLLLTFSLIPKVSLAAGVSEIADVAPMWKLFLSFAFVLILIPLAVLGMKKIQSFQLKLGKSPIMIEAVQSLGTKEKLMIVEVDDKRLLIGVTANSINLLKTLESERDFSDMLDNHTQTMNDESKQ